jgi:hypothetical protein
MKNILVLIAYLCLAGILVAGILFAAGVIGGATLNTVAIVLTIGWFALRLWPARS